MKSLMIKLMTIVKIALLFTLFIACAVDEAFVPTQITEATDSSTRGISEREEATSTTSPESANKSVPLTDTPSAEITTYSTESDQAELTPDGPPNDKDNIFIIEVPTPFDSPRIAFTSGDGDLRAMKPNGSDVIRLTFNGGPAPSVGYDRQPTWAPDRQRIAFVSPNEPKPAVEDATIIQLTSNGARNPDWSPDGNRIAFDYEEAIYVIDSEGTNLIRFSNAQGKNPTWSSDSRKVAFTKYGELYIASIDDSQVEHLALNNSLSDCPPMDVNAPAWSPNGQFIAFDSHPNCARGTGLSVYTLELDTLMVSDPVGLFYQAPDWSPDSNYIVFDSGIEEISIMSFPEGEVAVNDYIQGYPGSKPVWSP